MAKKKSIIDWINKKVKIKAELVGFVSAIFSIPVNIYRLIKRCNIRIHIPVLDNT